MKSNIASLIGLLCLSLFSVQGAEHATDAPDRFILRFQEKLDYWVRPYKLYEIWVPLSSIPANNIYHFRQNYIGGVSNKQ